MCDRAEVIGRPDLPLIALVLAAGAALAVFVDEGAAPVEPVGSAADGGVRASDPIDDFLLDFDPVFIDCFGRIDPRDGAQDVPGDPDAAVDVVSRRVERLRDLSFERPVAARFLGAQALSQRLLRLTEKELPPRELAREGQLLEELGAIPPASDLQEIAQEALGSQVVGLYDTRSKDLLVQSAGELGAEEEITVAHELEHALADQALGIPERLGGPAAADRELAFASVVEGDATLTMELYALVYIGLAEQLSLGQSVPGEDEFAALPDYVQRSLIFPYQEGLRLACHRYVEGGWRAVDRLYSKPPKGTNEVMFPQLYGKLEPVAVKTPATPGPGWKRLVRRELGAAELEWLFQAPGGEVEATLPDPRELVVGWAGGEVALWARGTDRALAISLAELEGADRLCGAVAAWYRGGWPEAEARAGTGALELTFAEPGRVAVLACDAARVGLGVAPNPRTALRLAR